MVRTRLDRVFLTFFKFKKYINDFSDLLQIISLIDSDEEKFNSTLDKAGLSRLSPAEAKYLREYVWVMQPVAAALDILQREEMYVGYLIPTVLRMGTQLTQRRQMNGKPQAPPALQCAGADASVVHS